MKTFKISLLVCVLIMMILVMMPYGLLCQERGFKVEIQFKKGIKDQIGRDLSLLQPSVVQELKAKKVKLTDKIIKKRTWLRYLESKTVAQALDMITPESVKWLRTFYQHTKRPAIADFDSVVRDNRGKTVREFRALSTKRSLQKPGRRTSKPSPSYIGTYLRNSDNVSLRKIASNEIWDDSREYNGTTPVGPININDGGDYANLLGATDRENGYSPPPSSQPYISDITDSKLIIKDNWDGAERYRITVPNGSIFLRGSYSNSRPGFPDYANVHCDNCCGPAAGESILEYFNVPITDSNGNVLQSPNDIQGRLSDLMETESGVDFTYPRDLADTLTRPEFVGSKGWWYNESDSGSRFYFDYFLSVGTPTIILLGYSDILHYVTVYGYDASNDKWTLANGDARTTSDLMDQWNFEDTGWEDDVAIYFGNLYPGTFFCYSPHGDAVSWPLSWFPPDGCTSQDCYFAQFNQKYVLGRNENGLLLNFHRILYDDMFWVTSGDQFVNLSSPNTDIISSASKTPLIIDGDTGKPQGLMGNIRFKACVDKGFLNTYDQLHCGFVIKAGDGSVIERKYGPFRNYIDQALSNSDPNNYVFAYEKAYSANMVTAEFWVHGGFRKIVWRVVDSVVKKARVLGATPSPQTQSAQKQPTTQAPSTQKQAITQAPSAQKQTNLLPVNVSKATSDTPQATQQPCGDLKGYWHWRQRVRFSLANPNDCRLEVKFAITIDGKSFDYTRTVNAHQTYSSFGDLDIGCYMNNPGAKTR